MTFPQILQLFNSKVVPAFNAAFAALPGIFSTEQADVQAALTALQKAAVDFQAGVQEIISAVKTAAAVAPPAA